MFTYSVQKQSVAPWEVCGCSQRHWQEGGGDSELWEGQTDAGPMGPCNLLAVTPGKSFQLSRFRFSFI